MPKNMDEKLQYELTYRDAVDILRAVKESEFCDSLELEFGDMKLSLTRAGAGDDAMRPAIRVAPEAPAEAPHKTSAAAPAPGEPTTPSADDAYAKVMAPMLGTFFVSASPNAPPYVQPGDRVAVGDTVGLIEVMKLFTPVTAGVAGKVVRVLAGNGSLVEHGQTLLLIDPT